MKQFFFLFLFSLIQFSHLWAQDAATIYREIERLNFLGSVLYVAAHPDDENTALLSHFSKHVHAHTGYLSLTRGDGGQNLIGTELREHLGVIRTQELLQARKIDGGEQFFTSAVDFGYSKHPNETLEIWEKDSLMGEVVARIRAFQPDIIIHRFDHRTPGKTHGHHTTSAILSHAAFDLSQNPEAYSEQLENSKPWQVRRQFFNTSWWFYGSQANFEKADKSNLLALQIGQYDPLTGRTNGQIAAESRSQHKSQGFGSSPRLGERIEYIELINGDLPKSDDPFEGINTRWSRVKNGAKIGKMIDALLEAYDFKAPAKSLPAMVNVYKAIEALPASVWKTRKQKAAEKLILEMAGLTLQLNATRAFGTKDEELKLNIRAVQQSPWPIELVGINQNLFNATLAQNELFNQEMTLTLPNQITTPYWLTQKGSMGRFAIAQPDLLGKPETPPLTAQVELKINNQLFKISRPVEYRITDPVRGEVVTPFYILPPVSVKIENEVQLFADQNAQDIRVEVTNFGSQFKGDIELCFPNGWEVNQARQSIELDRRGATSFLTYQLRPTPSAKTGLIGPLVYQNGKVLDKVHAVTHLEYDHIPKQYIAQPSEAKVVPLNLKLPAKKVGYLMGAGDLVAQQLRKVGMPITDIDLNSVSQKELNEFDVILVGIRAFNVHPELAFKNSMLFDFAAQGGTLIVQYNTSRGLKTDSILPYSIRLSRDRVTNENSEVRFLNPTHPVFHFPHKIDQADFEGWIQERGLYFANQWADEMTPLFGMNDAGEEEKKGSLLVGEYGKGKVVYTGLSFFRELPAGVPGAYRLLLNLIAQ